MYVHVHVLPHYNSYVQYITCTSSRPKSSQWLISSAPGLSSSTGHQDLLTLGVCTCTRTYDTIKSFSSRLNPTGDDRWRKKRNDKLTPVTYLRTSKLAVVVEYGVREEAKCSELLDELSILGGKGRGRAHYYQQTNWHRHIYMYLYIYKEYSTPSQALHDLAYICKNKYNSGRTTKGCPTVFLPVSI